MTFFLVLAAGQYSSSSLRTSKSGCNNFSKKKISEINSKLEFLTKTNYRQENDVQYNTTVSERNTGMSQMLSSSINLLG